MRISTLIRVCGSLASLFGPDLAGQTPTAADSALSACIAAAGAGDRKAARAEADRAQRLFRQMQQVAPRAAAPREGLARVISQCRIPFANMLSAGRLIGESNRLLEEALELEPTHWSARYTLALNHYHTPAFLGRTEDAIRHFETLIAQQGDRAGQPHLVRPYIYLGDLYQRTGRTAEAARLWQRAAALFPDSEPIRTRLAKAAVPEEAEELPAEAAAREAAAAREPQGPPVPLQGVTIRVRRLAPGVAVGGTSLTRLEVVTTPGGAADLLQGLRMQGGLTQATDGSDLFVRGGEPSESPVWVDGGRILYAGTFENLSGGLFGVLSPAVMREALFFSGGFSARYGNALSGALEVHTEGRPSAPRLSGGVSLAGATATGFVPLGERAGAWATAKATDATVMTWMQGTAEDFTESPRALEATVGLVADPRRDLELKATAVVQGDGATRWIEGYGHEGDFRSRGSTRVAVLSARIRRADGAAARLALSGSERTSDFRFGALQRDASDRTASAALNGGLPVSAATTVRGGAEAAWYGATQQGRMPATGSADPRAPHPWTEQSADTRHLGAYVEVETTPAERLSLVAGVRADLLPGESEATLDPRLSLAYHAQGWTVRLGGGIFQQGRWRVGYRVPDAGTPSGLPRRARHLMLGVEGNGATPLRVDAYLKGYDRYVSDGIGPQAVEGRVAGVDARYRWVAGESLSGWLVYSYLRGRVKLQEGAVVPSRVDVTHGLTAVGKWAIGQAWELGATARHATGRPYTPVEGSLAGAPGSAASPVFGAWHSERLPNYSRMDARVTHLGMLGERRVITYLELLNYLGRRNVMGYSYDADYQVRRPVESFFARPVAVLGMEVQLR